MFNPRLKEARQKAGLSLRDVQRSLGRSVSYWSDVERGNTDFLASELLPLSRLFGVDYQWLLEGAIPSSQIVAEEDIHQGCLCCPTVERIAPANMVVAVGFGIAQVVCDNLVVYDERDSEVDWTVEDAEKAALQKPNSDWRIIMEAPLRGREYQRRGEGVWVLIRSNKGFA